MVPKLFGLVMCCFLSFLRFSHGFVRFSHVVLFVYHCSCSSFVLVYVSSMVELLFSSPYK